MAQPVPEQWVAFRPFRCPELLPGSAVELGAGMHKDVVQMVRWHTSPTMGHILVTGDGRTTGTGTTALEQRIKQFTLYCPGHCLIICYLSFTFFKNEFCSIKNIKQNFEEYILKYFRFLHLGLLVNFIIKT